MDPRSRLDRLTSTSTDLVRSTERRSVMTLLAAAYRLVQRMTTAWDGLTPKEQETLRRFFAETRGDPRAMARRPSKERSEVVRIVRKAFDAAT